MTFFQVLLKCLEESQSVFSSQMEKYMKEKAVVTEDMLAAAKKSLAKPLKKKEGEKDD